MRFIIANAQKGARHAAEEVVERWKAQYSDHEFGFGYSEYSKEAALAALERSSVRFGGGDIELIQKMLGISVTTENLRVHMWNNSNHIQGMIFLDGDLPVVFFFEGRRISLYTTESSILEAFERESDGRPSDEGLTVFFYESSEPTWPWYAWKGWVDYPDRMYFEPPEWAIPR